MIPYINPFSFDGDANFGDNVQLMCHVSKGDLPIQINWLFRNIKIFSHLSVQTTKMGERSSFLTISSVRAENSGVYTCIASNDAGSNNYSTSLNVYGTFNTNFYFFFIFILISSTLNLTI